MQNDLKIFESQHVRSLWDDENEKWWFSIVDVIAVLTESDNPRRYLSDLKRQLNKEGSEVYENIVQLKMPAKDGKMRLTDVADQKQLLRLIQSIPSKKAEPFKIWLAEVGSDRIDESQNPELTLERAMRAYRDLGYDEQWINARLQSIHFRKELTDEWKR
ncbi:MAG: BRO-N domain-containing protein, partial [Lactococcus garvieae]